ncbi:MAG TPA: 50S ribosomal protein L9 [Candidatus Methylomirabilis sp.]|jgi:large subunit ribosomal protein L9
MRVILLTDVDRLGRAGQEVEVTAGYARNFLLPQRRAAEATAGNLRALQGLQSQAKKREGRLREQAEELARKIAGVRCTIPRRAGELDKLYGSVTNQDIADALGGQGIVVDRKRILLEEPIKVLGDSAVSVRLHPEVTAEIQVSVVRAA